MNDLKFTPIPEFSEPLTKREYFAAMAMQGLLAEQNETPTDIARYAVSYADALITELNKPTT